MRFLILIGFLVTTTSWAATLEFDRNDDVPPQIDTPYRQTRVKKIRCNQALWGVVYDYSWGSDHTGVKYLGVIDYEYLMSAQVAVHQDTTPGIVECREKIEKYYGLATSKARVLDLDATDTPAAAQ